MSALSGNDLRRIFEKLDKNRDGIVSLEELNWLLQRIGVELSLKDLESIIGKPSLDFEEFLFFYESIMRKDSQEEENEHCVDDHMSDLAKAFRVFDVDGDGFISCEELQSVLRRLGLWDETCGRDCKGMIRVFDTNLDGVIDFEEFKNMMLHF